MPGGERGSRGDHRSGLKGLAAPRYAFCRPRTRPGARLPVLGRASGALGFGSGEGMVTLAPVDGGTRLTYRYRAEVGGKVAAVGQRMLGTVTRVLIAEFFRALERRVAPSAVRPMLRWWAMLRAFLRRDSR